MISVQREYAAAVACVLLFTSTALGQATGPFFDPFTDEIIGPEYVVATGSDPQTGASEFAGALDVICGAGDSLMTVDLDPAVRVLSGDFDVRVRFELATGFTGFADIVRSSGLQLLDAATQTQIVGTVERMNTNTEMLYKAWQNDGFDPAQVVQLGTSDTAGRYRITRSGSQYDIYVWDTSTSAWVNMKTYTDTTADLIVRMFVTELFDPVTLEVMFDDFAILKPASDECVTAPMLDLGQPVLVDTNLDVSSNDPSDPPFSCKLGAPGVGSGTNFYQFTAPGSSVNVHTVGFEGNGDDSVLAVYAGSCGSLTELGCNDDEISTISFWSTVQLSGLTPGQTYTIQVAEYDNTSASGEFVLAVTSPTLYVDQTAAIGGDGQTWGRAFTELRDALGDAVEMGVSAIPLVQQVWITKGIYKRSTDPNEGWQSFALTGADMLIGGFLGNAYPGGGETSPTQRALNVDGRPIHETVISGDTLGDDVVQLPDIQNQDDNTLHPFIVPTDGTLTLDGVVVTAAHGYGVEGFPGTTLNATGCVFRYNGPAGAYPSGIILGGGVRTDYVTLSDCAFIQNRGGRGGAVEAWAGLTMDRCLVQGNYTADHAGAVYVEGTATIRDCEFRDNTARVAGGAIYYEGGDLWVTNTLFVGNSTFGGNAFQFVEPGGGAVAVKTGTTGVGIDAFLTNCRLLANSTAGDGGAVFAFGDPSTSIGTYFSLTNCLIAGNSATGNGGGLAAIYGAQPMLYDSTIVDNTGTGFDLVVGASDGVPGLIANSVLWGNALGDVSVTGGSFGVYHSILYESYAWPGQGNLDIDPVFADPDGADNIASTYEDNDYSLRARSPAIDSGRNDLVPQDNPDLDGDLDTSEPLPWDLAGQPRFHDDLGMPETGDGTSPLVDMGAYEFQGTSSGCIDQTVVNFEDGSWTSPPFTYGWNSGLVSVDCGRMTQTVYPTDAATATQTMFALDPAYMVLCGDFSVTVDFDVSEDFPISSAGPHQAGLRLRRADTNAHIGGISRVNQVPLAGTCLAGEQNYKAWLGEANGGNCSAGSVIEATTDQVGRFRAERVGNVITLSYLTPTGWHVMNSAVVTDVDLWLWVFTATSAPVTDGHTVHFDNLAINQYVTGTTVDCNANGTPDVCDLSGGADDCNANGVLDACETAGGGIVEMTSDPDVRSNIVESYPYAFHLWVPDSFPVADLTVELGIRHTWVGDLCLTLEHNGVAVKLIERMGAVLDAGDCTTAMGDPGCGDDNLADVVLDDAAAQPIHDACGFGTDLVGRFSPEQPLSALSGMDAHGDWTLKLLDGNEWDGGTFESWSLRFTTQAEDCEPDGVPDVCQLDQHVYALDDGGPFGWFSVHPDLNVALLNHFTVVEGSETVQQLEAFWTMQHTITGQAVTAYLWSDPNGDGDPTDAAVLASAAHTVPSSDRAVYDLPATYIGPAGTSFFAGLITAFVSDEFTMQADAQSAASTWWVTSDPGTPIDPNDLAASSGPDPLFWVVVMRAIHLGGGPDDCNNNAVPDGCELDTNDCNGNLVPDDCDLAAGTVDDCNANGVPDSCDIDQGALDCQGNGVLDECELAGNDCNDNGLIDGCELTDGAIDCQPDGVLDACQVDSQAYSWDDGTQEIGISAFPDGITGWINHFTALAGRETIHEIHVAWGDIPNGTAATVYLWSDPNGDGDPTDAQVLASAATTVQYARTNVLSVVEITPTDVGSAGTSFFVGAIVDHSGLFASPAALDLSSSSQESWLVGWLPGFGVDPDALGTAPLPPALVDDVAGSGNLLVRAVSLGGGADDCNDNAIPDVCDIAGGADDCDGNGVLDSCDLAAGGLDCQSNGVLDACELAGNDCNGNGLPDACDLAGGATDCQPDSVLDACQVDSFAYSYDDGTQEISVPLVLDGVTGWMNHFTIQAGSETIQQIHIAWGDVSNGSAATVYLWSDPNGDGDPTDAQVVASAATTVQYAGADALSVVEITPTTVGSAGTSFFAGALVDHTGVVAAPPALDQDSSWHESWVVGWLTGFPADPNDLGGAPFPPMLVDDTGAPGNFLVRAVSLGGGGADADGNGIPDVCESVVPGPPVGTGEVAKTNRYLRFSAPAPTVAGTGQEVIRVTIISLDGYPFVFTTELYLGPPFAAPEEDSTQPGLTFTAAPLQCDPYAHDWSAEGTISAYGAEIIPGSTYQVQRAASDCPNLLSDPGCWSAPLTITTGKYGDVWPLFDEPGNPPQPDFNDIAAMVNKFLAAGSAVAPIKAVAQLQPNAVFPDRAVDFRDIAADVQAFLGVTIAEAEFGPCLCPSIVTCGTTACSTDLNCSGVTPSGGLCVGGFCTDPCGRCTP